jgi:hypothetical protein
MEISREETTLGIFLLGSYIPLVAIFSPLVSLIFTLMISVCGVLGFSWIASFMLLRKEKALKEAIDEEWNDYFKGNNEKMDEKKIDAVTRKLKNEYSSTKYGPLLKASMLAYIDFKVVEAFFSESPPLSTGSGVEKMKPITAANSSKSELIRRSMDFEIKMARYFESQGYVVHDLTQRADNRHLADMVLTQSDGTELLLECKFRNKNQNQNRKIKRRVKNRWEVNGIELVGEKEFEDGYVLFGRKNNNNSTEEE